MVYLTRRQQGLLWIYQAVKYALKIDVIWTEKSQNWSLLVTFGVTTRQIHTHERQKSVGIASKVYLTRRQQGLLWKRPGVPLEQMDDLVRIRVTSELVSSIPASSTLVKNFGTLMDQLFWNFFLKVPQRVDSKLWNHWYPPHNLTPSLRVHLPRILGIFVILWTIFGGRTCWEMDVVYRVSLTFAQNPVRGWCIHHFGAWLWTGFTLVTRDNHERYLDCVIFTHVEQEVKGPPQTFGYVNN